MPNSNACVTSHQRKWELDHFGDRRPASNDLQTPYAVRMEYNDAIVRWDQARVPSFYNDTHSIFVDRSMDTYYEIYSLDAEAQVQQLRHPLQNCFRSTDKLFRLHLFSKITLTLKAAPSA
jgi:hypothetical protein